MAPSPSRRSNRAGGGGSSGGDRKSNKGNNNSGGRSTTTSTSKLQRASNAPPPMNPNMSRREKDARLQQWDENQKKIAADAAAAKETTRPTQVQPSISNQSRRAAAAASNSPSRRSGGRGGSAAKKPPPESSKSNTSSARKNRKRRATEEPTTEDDEEDQEAKQPTSSTATAAAAAATSSSATGGARKSPARSTKKAKVDYGMGIRPKRPLQEKLLAAAKERKALENEMRGGGGTTISHVAAAVVPPAAAAATTLNSTMAVSAATAVAASSRQRRAVVPVAATAPGKGGYETGDSDNDDDDADDNGEHVPPPPVATAAGNQAARGVSDPANSLRSTAVASASASSAAAAAQDNNNLLDDQSSYNSDDSYYDSSTNGSLEDEVDGLQQDTAEYNRQQQQQQQVAAMQQPPPKKRGWFSTLGIVALAGFLLYSINGYLVQQGFFDMQEPVCYADTPPSYDSDAGVMVPQPTKDGKYCEDQRPCPEGAECKNGTIQSCPELFDVAGDGLSCVLSGASIAKIDTVKDLLQGWSSTDICGHPTEKKGDVDWENVPSTFFVGSRRPLFDLHYVSRALASADTSSAAPKADDLRKLILAANQTSTGGEPPLFVIQENKGTLIGLHPEQHITRSSVCVAKQFVYGTWILVLSLFVLCVGTFKSLCGWLWAAFLEEPLFVGVSAAVAIPTLLFVMKKNQEFQAKREKTMHIVKIRNTVMDRIKDAGGREISSKSLLDDIKWKTRPYSMESRLRKRIDAEWWKHVVRDIDSDDTIVKQDRIVDGERQLIWKYRYQSAAAAAAASSAGGAHVRFAAGGP